MIGSIAYLVEPGDEAELQLASLGLSKEDILYVAAGMIEGFETAHPEGMRSEGGILKYSRGMGAWAERLSPRGWRRRTERGAELIVSPDESISITITAGSEAGGNREFSPKAKYPRGAATRRKVRINQTELGLFTVAPLTIASHSEDDGQLMWMLLHRWARGRVILELSLPSDIEEDGTTISWQTRIFLGEVGHDENGGPGLFPTPNDPTPNTPIVTVRPRSA